LSVITGICPALKYPATIYYLDGDCAFCLGKAKDFDEKNSAKSNNSIILFRVSDPLVSKMYVENLSLKSCVIMDTSGLFANSLALNTIYILSEKGEMLSERPDK
jgi:hypothetical protein